MLKFYFSTDQGRGGLRPVLLLLAIVFVLASSLMVCDFVCSAAHAAQKVRIDVPAVIYLPDSDAAFKLGDVAKITGPRKAVDSLSKLILSVTTTGSAKKKNKTRSITQAQVLRAIETSGLDDMQIELYMAKTVKVERPAAVGNRTVVPVEPIEPMIDTGPTNAPGSNSSVNDRNFDLNSMVKSLAAWDGDVEVTANATIPPGKLVKPASIVPGSGAATLQFQDNSGRVRSLAIRMTWTQNVIMAARPIARNKIIRREDLMTRQMRITQAGQYATRIDQVVGHISRKDLAQGAPMELSLLSSATLLKRGRNVKIIARAGGVMVKADGSLLDDGSIGDIVRVRRSGAEYKKTELRARIIDENTVEVEVN